MSNTEKYSDWAGHPISSFAEQNDEPTGMLTSCRCVKDLQSEFDPDYDFKLTLFRDTDMIFITDLAESMARLINVIERLNQNLEQKK